MAGNSSMKLCEMDSDSCKRQVRGLCFHCSKNLCRIHLEQHVQLIEEHTRTELNSLADKFNELSSKFNDLTKPSELFLRPFSQLAKLCSEAHAKIDEIADKKRMEITYLMDEYKKSFLANNKEQLEKINDTKKMIGLLMHDNDASNEQIANLQASIDSTEKYLNSLKMHEINITAYPPTWRVEAAVPTFWAESQQTDNLRKFKITYIRCDGGIDSYDVKTHNNGTMRDLVRSFVEQYHFLEGFSLLKSNSRQKTNHRLESDFILPVEVYNYNHQIHSQFKDTSPLNEVSPRHSIVFYQVPYPLHEEHIPHILMPCCFRRASNESYFGWPIYLNIPRKGCRGQDIQNALHIGLRNFFPFDPVTDIHFYEAYLQTVMNSRTNEIKLNDSLNDEIGFTRMNVTLWVNISDEIADKYEENIVKELEVK